MGKEVGGDTLIAISKHIIKLSSTKTIILNDTTGRYSAIIQNVCSALQNNAYDESNDAGKYVKDLMSKETKS
jgi:hypothetical protein